MSPRLIALAGLLSLGTLRPTGAQQAAPRAAAKARAPAVSNIRYELTFDSATALRRTVQVVMRFDVTGTAPVLLSLPAWTPGAYEISNYARRVSGFSATGGGRAATWDKTDYDTWRVRPITPGAVEVRFDFRADTLDNAAAWSRRDFLLVNGTNVFPYPEGIGLGFPATVTVRTSAGWRILSGLDPDGSGHYRAGNYHDLVDMPFFIGRFDLDSTQIGGVWHRLASYPAGQFTGAARALLQHQLQGFVPEEAKVFGETPWKNYSTMLIFEPSMNGGAALEHQSSHVGIYNPAEFIGTPLLASVTAHEMFHSWNVKRLRPADLVPYRYDQPEPTRLLWVSEGITDYYADLVLVRGGVVDSTGFLNLTEGKIQHTEETPPVGLAEASLTTWIHPLDGTEYIYYDKGSLAGLMLDILIRDASDNRHSLDDVLRALYQSTYKHGKGFTTADFWAAASFAAGGKSFVDFAARYVDGREPFPWKTMAPLAGFLYHADSARVPRLGVTTQADSNRVMVTGVTAGGAADEAGIEAGDQLLRVGEIEVKNDDWGEPFRNRYGNVEGTIIPVVVRRHDVERTFPMAVRRALVVTVRLQFDPQAGGKALKVRNGILRGTAGNQ